MHSRSKRKKIKTTKVPENRAEFLYNLDVVGKFLPGKKTIICKVKTQRANWEKIFYIFTYIKQEKRGRVTKI